MPGLKFHREAPILSLSYHVNRKGAYEKVCNDSTSRDALRSSFGMKRLSLSRNYHYPLEVSVDPYMQRIVQVKFIFIFFGVFPRRHVQYSMIYQHIVIVITTGLSWLKTRIKVPSEASIAAGFEFPPTRQQRHSCTNSSPWLTRLL